MKEIKEESSTQIPCSETSQTSFSSFIKLCKGYYKELKSLANNNHKLSKTDLVVINDFLKELTHYSGCLLNMSLKDESKLLIIAGIKIVDSLLVIFNTVQFDQDPQSLLQYPFSLKLNLLEIRFQILLNEGIYEEAEKTVEEVMNIQKILKMQRFFIGSSMLYLAIVKFSNFLLLLNFKK
jgi:hypothetical protein